MKTFIILRKNISLIEVMGLAVLPARLKSELQDIQEFLVNATQHVADYHQDWAKQLKEKYGQSNTLGEAATIIQRELGIKFARVLEDAGIFKQTDVGIDAFKRFITTLND